MRKPKPLNPGERAIRFINNLTHIKGAWAGQPFRLRPWQVQRIIRPLFGTITPAGIRQYRTCYVEIPRKNGKALALDTPLPTPIGWTMMGEVAEGDLLFDERGIPCRVIGESGVLTGRPCYRIVFDDGTEITADGGHLWQTRQRFSCRSRADVLVSVPRRRGTFLPRGTREQIGVRTTEEIRSTLHYGTIRNHSIAIAGPLQLPAVNCSVDPYVLGVWLGDGNSKDSAIIVPDVDREILAYIEAAGVSVGPRRNIKSKTPLGLYGLGVTGHGRQDSLHCDLKRLGVLRNKHIPSAYMRGSVYQRLSLLRGLMDTDGSIAPRSGCCVFTQAREALARQVGELVASLGMKYTLRKSTAPLHGKLFTRWDVCFYPPWDMEPFRLKRKLQHHRRRHNRQRMSATRMIVSIELVPSVPVKCVAVDSPSHLYLAGEGMVPTHNTELAAAVALYMLIGDGEPGGEVYSVAVDLDQASLAFNVAAQMVGNDPELAARLQVIPSRRRIVDPVSNSVYRAIPGDAPSSHGYNASAIVADELHAWPNRQLWDVMSTSTGARPQPVTFIITTAGWDRNSICYELHTYAEKILEGSVDDPTFLPILYGAPREADWTDEAIWRAANPALGDFRDLEEMRTAAKRAGEIPAQQNTFRRLYLCQWTEQGQRAIDMDIWNDAAPARVDLAGLAGRRCFGGLDLASSSDLAVFLLLFPPLEEDEPYHLLTRFWIPGENIGQRVMRDRTPYDRWVQDGLLTPTEGNLIDYDVIREQIRADAQTFNIVELAYDRWGAIQLATQLQGDGLTMVPLGQGFSSLAAPTKEFLALVAARRIAHGGHPILRWMASNLAVKQDAAGNLKPDKGASREKIDAIVALVMALDRVMRGGGGRSVYEERDLVVLG